MAETIEMKICKDCGIVVTDSRTGSRAVFTIGDLEPFYKGMTPQLIGSDGGGLGYRISVEYHEEETETKEKAKKWDKYTLDGKNITPEIIEQIEELEEKREAVTMWLKNAKAQGRISMSDGMKLDEILGDS